MARNPNFDPFHLSQSCTKIRKTNGRPWLLSNQFGRWSGYINWPNCRPLLLSLISEMDGNPKFDPFHSFKITQILGKSRNLDQNFIGFEGGHDTPAGQISGHSFYGLPGIFIPFVLQKMFETPNLTDFIKIQLCQNYENKQIIPQI